MGRCLPVVFLTGANLFGGLEPIHYGHLHVHGHQVEFLFGQDLQSDMAIFSNGDHVPHFLEEPRGQTLIDEIVLDEQNSQSHARVIRGLDCRGDFDLAHFSRQACSASRRAERRNGLRMVCEMPKLLAAIPIRGIERPRKSQYHGYIARRRCAYSGEQGKRSGGGQILFD